MVEITPGERMAVLKQNQFEFDEQIILKKDNIELKIQVK